MSFTTARRIYLGLFLAALLITTAGVYWLYAHPGSVPPWAKPLTEGYLGNFTAGIVGSVLFLFLTLFLGAQTEASIDHIRQIATKSEQTLSARERLLRNEQLIRQFDEFARKESYHDVRFPNVKPTPDSLGLEYTIVPVRDDKGEPRKYETEMHTWYLVRVQGPAHWEVMKPEEKKQYDASPIREDEFYYCGFYGDSWYMGTDAPVLPHAFYLSGKVGPVEHGRSANEVMEAYENPLAGLTKLASLRLSEDGTPTSGGFTPHDIYKDDAGNLFLRIWKSRPKKMFYTNPPETYDDSGWFFVIDGIRGYAHGAKLENIKKAVLEKLAELGVAIPKVPWYETDEHRFNPPL